MAASLVLCAGCSRHVRATESTCPFCDAALEGAGGGAAVPRAALAVAVALSAGLALNACYGGPRRPAAYNNTPEAAAPSAAPTPAPTEPAPAAPAPAPGTPAQVAQ